MLYFQLAVLITLKERVDFKFLFCAKLNPQGDSYYPWLLLIWLCNFIQILWSMLTQMVEDFDSALVSMFRIWHTNFILLNKNNFILLSLIMLKQQSIDNVRFLDILCVYITLRPLRPGSILMCNPVATCNTRIITK